MPTLRIDNVSGRAYPRECGEHFMARASSVISVGLSPLARGTPHTIITTSIRIRFIPAGAGNTTYAELAEEEEPVYPRWRGEHNFTNLRKVAGAGNTWQRVTSPTFTTVYPRWRGEHNFCSMSLTPIAGLSPLARGTHHCSLGPLLRDRFIPAGAGNTRLRPRTNGWRTVYPRWRGEHSQRHK